MEISMNDKLNMVSELSRLKLAKILKTIAGTKNLIIEQNLIRSLDKICGTKWLRLCDVDKIYKYDDNVQIQSSNNARVYLISSNLLQFKRVLNQIEASINSKMSQSTTYHIIVIPKVLNCFEALMEEMGLYGKVLLHSYMWQFILVDIGILSLEIPYLFTDIFVNKNLSLLPTIGKSISSLFYVTGIPKVIVSIGKYSQDVRDHIQMFTENLGPPTKVDSDFGALLIMDRSVDYVGALLTNVTYSGLLSEVFKISGNVVEDRCLKPSVEDIKDKSKSFFSLDSKNDCVYSEIKNRHISEVSDILGNQTRQLKVESEKSRELALSEIKSFVQTKLQSVTAKSRYLSYHLQACEKIIAELAAKFETLQTTERSLIENINKNTNLSTIEDFIFTENKLISLRLICLVSLTQKLTYDEYNNLKMKYLQTYGYKLLYLFQHLDLCGMNIQPVQTKLPMLSLPTISSKKDFYSVANKLKLIPLKPEEMNVRVPTCPSYVYGGNYIPVVAQLLTLLVQVSNEGDLQSKIDLLGGSIKTQGPEKPFPLQQRTILVFVIGGLTYAEIAACNFIEKVFSCKIVMSSNCMVSGNDLVSQCM